MGIEGALVPPKRVVASLQENWPMRKLDPEVSVASDSTSCKKWDMSFSKHKGKNGWNNVTKSFNGSQTYWIFKTCGYSTQ